MLEAKRGVAPRAIGPEELTRVLDVTRKLAARFDLATMLTEVVRAAEAVIEAEGGSLWLYEKERHELVMRVATGMEPVRLSADKGLVGECVRTRAIINVPDCYADPRFNRDVDKHSGFRTRCMLTLPLVGHDDALVGVLQILNKRKGVFDSHDEQLAAALAAQCAVALQRVQMTEALVAGERLKQEIAVAREIQQGTLPRTMPALAGYEVFGAFHPADETGGDTFDLAPLPGDRLLVMMGDATGHGIGPALSVTQMQAMLRLAVRLDAGLDAAYRHVNNQLNSDLPPERFVTGFIGVLDGRGHALEFHAAGQGPILHLRAATGAVERGLPTTFPLGAFPVEQPRPSRRLALGPGDVVALLSDGVFEWPGADGSEFGIERVETLLREQRGLPLAQLAALIHQRARAFGGPQADDVTIVLLRRAHADADAAAELSLSREFAALEAAVALVREFWARNALPDADRFAVDFAIEELFTNMVKYGRKSDTRITLRLQREASAVAVLLVDPDSDPFDPTAARPVDLAAPIEKRTPGRLGLPLIHKLVDDFAFEYAGSESRVSFRKKLES
ncbi:MAG: ATP-binding SpoIIE family protein phosphatase [Gammaproteobacteria bacterium]